MVLSDRSTRIAARRGISVARKHCHGERDWRIVHRGEEHVYTRGQSMSKGMDRKREAKKKPAKSLQEKRAAKKEKKDNRAFRV
jgi:hypothetical protein